MPYRWTLTDLKTMDFVVLDKDPLGWDDGIYSIKRSEQYKGAFHEYTTSLKFHCRGGGKQFVDDVYATDDIDGRIDVLVEYDCDGSGNYDSLFNGIINLASYKTDGDYTIVTIEKSDLLTKLMSRDEISVDLETTTSIGGSTITAVDTEIIPMHSTEIEFISNWVVEKGYSYSAIESYSGIAAGWNAYFSHLASVNSSDWANTLAWTEYDSLGSTKDVVSFQASLVQPIMEFNPPGIITPQTVTWEIDFSGTFTDNETVLLQLRSAAAYKLNMYYGKKQSGTIMNVVTIYDGPGDGGGGYTADPFTENFVIQKTGTITLNPGDNIYLAWYIIYDTLTGANTIATTWVYDRSTFTIRGTTKYKETTTKAVLVHEAFNQVVDAIADTDGNFESELYGRQDSQKQTYSADGCGSLIGITNGLNIREFPNKPILCSFKDLFEAMDCQHNIGMGIVDGKIRVEPLAYFFDRNTKIISLPKVKSYETTNDNKRYLNKIEIGYQKWESEFHGGLDDPNATREYATKVSSVKNAYSKLCKYISSSFTIEFTRRKNIEIVATEDWRYDNDNFIIALKRGPYVNFTPELYADSFSSGSGMNSLSTAYNIRFTPLRMLLAHLNVISAGIQLIQGAIKFVTGSGNTSLEVAKDDVGCQEDYSGVAIAENDSINWNDSNAANIQPLWLTETYAFEYPLSYQQFKAIKTNPYGYVEFYRFADEVKKGFILNMDYQMKTGKTKFLLLKANV